MEKEVQLKRTVTEYDKDGNMTRYEMEYCADDAEESVKKPCCEECETEHGNCCEDTTEEDAMPDVDEEDDDFFDEVVAGYLHDQFVRMERRQMLKKLLLDTLRGAVLGAAAVLAVSFLKEKV